MLKKIALGFAAALALLLVVVALQPATFEVKRSVRVEAPPEVTYALLDDLRAYDGWNPWSKMDPAMKKTFSGAPRGVGAVYDWDGPQVGAGRMTITETTPNAAVHVALVFTKPFEAENQVVWAVTPVPGAGGGPASQVTWTMSGRNTFLGKVVCLFGSMDKMVGGDFDKGLADLKQQAEARAKATATAAPPGQPAGAAADPSAPASK